MKEALPNNRPHAVGPTLGMQQRHVRVRALQDIFNIRDALSSARTGLAGIPARPLGVVRCECWICPSICDRAADRSKGVE